MKTYWIALLLTPLLAACASVPDYRYYTLDMSPGAGAESAGIELGSVRIGVNEALARPEILIRTSPTQIEYYALDRWAGGLDEQISEKLKSEFNAAAVGMYEVRVDGLLMAFEQADTPTGAEARVKLDMRFDVTGGSLAPDWHSFSRLYLASEPASTASAAAVVEALSRAVETVAAEMARDIEQFVARETNQSASN